MDRINSANTIDLGGGKRGFGDLNLAANTRGTQVNAQFMNGVQESLLGTVEGVGLVPDANNNGQHMQAIRRLAGANVTALAYAVASGGFLALVPDEAGVVTVDASGGNVVLTLPAASGAGGKPLRFLIVRLDQSANTFTVKPSGTDTLAPGTAANASLGDGEQVLFVGDGVSAWRVLRNRPSPWVSYTNPGTVTDTVPAGYTQMETELVGGGGAGAMSQPSSGNYQSGAGGGAGGYASGVYPVTPGQQITHTIGAGGIGGTPTTPATGGGTSSSGSFCSGIGGAAAAWNNPSASPGGGGGGGLGGQVNALGGDGGDGQSGSVIQSGAGGASALGGGGRSGSPSGLIGTAPGSGGGGSYNSSGSGNGGNGAAGIVNRRWLP